MNYSLEKQKLLLSYLLSDGNLFTKVSPILKTTYFDARLKTSVNFIKDYYDKYKASPTQAQLKAETGQSLELTQLTRQEIKYAEKELETFCRDSAIEMAIMAAPKMKEDGNLAKAIENLQEAMMTSLSRDIGVDYFANPEARLTALANATPLIPTGYVKFDEYLGGGLNRKEMFIVLGAPGYGKSLTLANLAKNLLKKKLNGVYISLELAEEVVAKRFDTMFSGISSGQILRNITEASVKINQQRDKYGNLFIVRMPESTTNSMDIRAYLKEFEIVNGYLPDFMCVDYLDLMASNQAISAENFFARDKYISEELRAIANDFNLIMITASQLNRGAQSIESIEDLGQGHIAGGISKINTADNVAAIYPSAQAKARGEMIFKFIKTRSSNGVGSSATLKFNASSLCLENMEDDVPDGTNRLSNSISNYVNRKAQSSVQPTKSEEPKSTGTLDINNLPFQV
jgi:archaellum biogenesis ATPase FlaH